MQLRLLWGLQACCRSTAKLCYGLQVGAEHPAQGREAAVAGGAWLPGRRQESLFGLVSGHWVTAREHRRVGARSSTWSLQSCPPAPTLTTLPAPRAPGLTHGPSLSLKLLPLLC